MYQRFTFSNDILKYLFSGTYSDVGILRCYNHTYLMLLRQKKVTKQSEETKSSNQIMTKKEKNQSL